MRIWRSIAWLALSLVLAGCDSNDNDRDPYLAALEWVDPVAGASDLPPTDTQALPEGADELTTQYHSLFAAQVADWWLKLR